MQAHAAAVQRDAAQTPAQRRPPRRRPPSSHPALSADCALAWRRSDGRILAPRLSPAPSALASGRRRAALSAILGCRLVIILRSAWKERREREGEEEGERGRGRGKGTSTRHDERLTGADHGASARASRACAPRCGRGAAPARRRRRPPHASRAGCEQTDEGGGPADLPTGGGGHAGPGATSADGARRSGVLRAVSRTCSCPCTRTASSSLTRCSTTHATTSPLRRGAPG